ncbi:MAG TPA: hypothetical protein VKQ08_07580, partial [Cyclobacteriaceae bacterium]|nr:hypothetical protein [Cyclobacteriaceae bacterium]
EDFNAFCQILLFKIAAIYAIVKLPGNLGAKKITTDGRRCTRIREIPKGFYPSARRWEERATPGKDRNRIKTPTWFHQMNGEMIQLLQS